MSPEQETIYKAGLDYINRNLSILPVGKNKQPLLSWKNFQTVRATKQDLDFWIKFFPDMQLGIVTGKISNIIVVDVDDPKMDLSWLPETAVIKTGSGGFHYYYQYVKGFSNKARIKESIDIRGDGGFVVAPPSFNENGQYVVLKKMVCQPFPIHLFQQATEKSYTAMQTAYMGYGEGQRNEQMTKFIGHILAKIHPSEWESLAWPVICEANNKNTPPLPVSELRTIFLSISSKEKNNSTDRWYKKAEAKVLPTVRLKVKENYKDRYTWGTRGLDTSLAIIKRGNFIILAAKRSSGKCLGKGTKIIMFDGTLKNVEDIVIGDKLMGDDSSPRIVKSLARGREMMYWIRQKVGINYRVNESHILSLEWARCRNNSYEKNQRIDIKLLDYLKLNKTTQEFLKGYKVPFNFSDKKVSVDPYFLGVWLGDGHTKDIRVTISNKKIRIKKFIHDYAEKIGLKVTHQKEKGDCETLGITTQSMGYSQKFSLQQQLKKLGVLGRKHIPHIYLENSRKKRLQLLAGLLDTDGYSDGSCEVEITQKSKELAYQIKFLADSLGFRTGIKLKKCTIKSINFVGYYWRVRIIGDISIIPCKEHKFKKWTSVKSGYRTKIDIEKDKIDDYYGFEIDGNGRFLLEDGTVTHNTTMAFDMACKNAMLGHKVLYISLEMEERSIKEDFARKYAGITIEEEYDYAIPANKQKSFEKKIAEINAISNLFFRGMRRGSSVKWNAIVELINEFDDLDLIFIDNLDLIEGEERENDLERQKRVTKNIMSLTAEKKIPIVLIHHHRKSQTNGKDFGADELAGSGKIGDNADIILKITRNTTPDAIYPDKYRSRIFQQKGRGYSETSRIVYFIRGTFVDEAPAIDEYDGYTASLYETGNMVGEPEIVVEENLEENSSEQKPFFWQKD